MKAGHAFALVVAGIGAAAAAAVATSPSDDYAYAWPLQVNGDSAAWQVELTPEVYAAITRADLGDVEVINADGDAVAVAVHRLSTTTTSTADTPRPLPLFSLPAVSTSKSAGNETIRLHVRRDADGKLRSIDAQVAAPQAPTDGSAVARDDGTAIDAVRERALLVDASALKLPMATLLIDWNRSADNVTAQFAIDASDDLQQWRSVATNASVLRLAQGDHVLERHDIALGGVRAAYLRLRRLDDGPPLRGLRVSVTPLSLSTPAQAALTWVAATADGSTGVPATRGTDRAGGSADISYLYRLPAPLRIEGLRVRCVDDNTLAALALLSRSPDPRADQARWTARGGYVAFRLRQGDTLLENDDFPFAAADRVRDLRLDTPLALGHPPIVSVAYRPDRFVFLAQGRGPFRLVAGSARRTRAAYPVATALAPLRAKFGEDWQPPLATLGARQVLQGDRALVAPPAEAAPRDWRTWLLWSALVGAAALIGGLSLKLLRGPRGGA